MWLGIVLVIGIVSLVPGKCDGAWNNNYGVGSRRTSAESFTSGGWNNNYGRGIGSRRNIAESIASGGWNNNYGRGIGSRRNIAESIASGGWNNNYGRGYGSRRNSAESFASGDWNSNYRRGFGTGRNSAESIAADFDLGLKKLQQGRTGGGRGYNSGTYASSFGPQLKGLGSMPDEEYHKYLESILPKGTIYSFTGPNRRSFEGVLGTGGPRPILPGASSYRGRFSDYSQSSPPSKYRTSPYGSAINNPTTSYPPPKYDTNPSGYDSAPPASSSYGTYTNPRLPSSSDSNYYTRPSGYTNNNPGVGTWGGRGGSGTGSYRYPATAPSYQNQPPPQAQSQLPGFENGDVLGGILGTAGVVRGGGGASSAPSYRNQPPPQAQSQLPGSEDGSSLGGILGGAGVVRGGGGRGGISSVPSYRNQPPPQAQSQLPGSEDGSPLGGFIGGAGAQRGGAGSRQGSTPGETTGDSMITYNPKDGEEAADNLATAIVEAFSANVRKTSRIGSDSLPELCKKVFAEQGATLKAMKKADKTLLDILPQWREKIKSKLAALLPTFGVTDPSSLRAMVDQLTLFAEEQVREKLVLTKAK